MNVAIWPNKAAIESYNTGQQTTITIRQSKYLNNVIEQDHRRVKQRVRPMLGFKRFDHATITITGIELVHQIQNK